MNTEKTKTSSSEYFLIKYETAGTPIPSEIYPSLNSGYSDIRTHYAIATQEEIDRQFDGENVRSLQIFKNVKAIILRGSGNDAGSKTDFVLVANGERILYGTETVLIGDNPSLGRNSSNASVSYCLYEGEDGWSRNPILYEGEMPFPRIFI